MRTLFLLCLATLIGLGSLTAQQTATVAPRGLDDLRSTYQTALKKIHAPLLQQYLTELQSRRSALTLATDLKAMDEEITRIQGLIAGSGVFEPLQKPAASGLARDSAEERTGILVTLDPQEALPTPPDATAKDSMVPLGTAEWKISSLPAGEYDLMALCSCPDRPDRAGLSVSVADKSYSRPILPIHVTKASKTRLLRLCGFSLKVDSKDLQVKITANPSSTPWFFIRQAFISKKAKPE